MKKYWSDTKYISSIDLNDVGLDWEKFCSDLESKDDSNMYKLKLNTQTMKPNDIVLLEEKLRAYKGTLKNCKSIQLDFCIDDLQIFHIMK